MSTLLIRHTDDQTEYAVLENGSLVRYEKDISVKGDVSSEQIYLARIDRFMAGNQSVFVKLDDKHTGFLQLSECKRTPSSGEALLLQVKKPPVGNKAAYMTEDISIAGKTAILLPFTRKTGVSSRITDPESHARLSRSAITLCPPGMGLILRSEALETDEQSIRKEISALLDKWNGILENASHVSCPGLVYDRIPASDMIMRDEKGLTEAISDQPSALPFPCRVEADAFSRLNIYDKLRRRLQRNIWLPCGGYITVDLCEALTVIDVNSGKYQGIRKDRNAGIRKLNSEAAAEIAAVIRLRNISGIIIIDFVDMDTENDRTYICGTLSAYLSSDPVKTVIHGFTSLGLLEMTRKRNARVLPGPEV